MNRVDTSIRLLGDWSVGWKSIGRSFVRLFFFFLFVFPFFCLFCLFTFPLCCVCYYMYRYQVSLPSFLFVFVLFGFTIFSILPVLVFCRIVELRKMNTFSNSIVCLPLGGTFDTSVLQKTNLYRREVKKEQPVLPIRRLHRKCSVSHGGTYAFFVKTTYEQEAVARPSLSRRVLSDL